MTYHHNANTAIQGVIDVNRDSATPVARLTVRNMHIKQQGGRHGIRLFGETLDARIFNCHIERTGSNVLGGAHHEIHLEAVGDDDRWPKSTWISNVLIDSAHGGSDDGIQLQNVGETLVEYMSFTGTKAENWVDLKPRPAGGSGSEGPYSFYRCVFPARGTEGSNTFLTRANVNLTECVFDAAGTGQSAIVVGNSSMSKANGPALVRLVRCFWINTIGADTNMINWTSNGTEANPAVDFIGCHSDGGEFENKTNAGWVRWINCKLTDTTFTHHVDEDGFVCDNNEISGGAGWDDCT